MSKENIYHRTNCRLCESNNLKTVIPLEKIPLTEKYINNNQLNTPHELFPIDIYMCLDCSHVQLLDVINPDILWDDFTFRTGQAQIIIDHMKDVAQETCDKYKIQKNSLIIDVGSNDGTLLQGFKDNGMKVLGIDPAKEIALEKDINTNWLNDVVKGFLSEKSEFNSYLELSNLKILTASPSYLLAMKCLATHDVDDIRFLIRYLNLESCEEIFGILDQYYPLKRYPQKTVYFLEGLFE